MIEAYLHAFAPTMFLGAGMALSNFPFHLTSKRCGDIGVWVYTFGWLELVFSRVMA